MNIKEKLIRNVAKALKASLVANGFIDAEGNIKSKNLIKKLGLKDYQTIKNAYVKNGVNIDTHMKIINVNDFK